MDVRIEYLKHEDLEAYKRMIDGVLGESVPLDVYALNYDAFHPSVKVVVAKLGEEIVGTITFVLIDTFTSPLDPRIEFSNFATTVAARGTRAATDLMDFVTDYAIEYGYQSITVNCLKDAERAHNFYEKMGFERLDTVRFRKKISE